MSEGPMGDNNAIDGYEMEPKRIECGKVKITIVCYFLWSIYIYIKSVPTWGKLVTSVDQKVDLTSELLSERCEVREQGSTLFVIVLFAFLLSHAPKSSMVPPLKSRICLGGAIWNLSEEYTWLVAMHPLVGYPIFG